MYIARFFEIGYYWFLSDSALHADSISIKRYFCMQSWAVFHDIAA